MSPASRAASGEVQAAPALVAFFRGGGWLGGGVQVHDVGCSRRFIISHARFWCLRIRGVWKYPTSRIRSQVLNDDPIKGEKIWLNVRRMERDTVFPHPNIP